MTDHQFVLEVPQGRFELRRHPHRAMSPLRAWDAADEYLLRTVAEDPPPGTRWLVVNDGFGALAVALAAHRPQSWSDSLLAHRGAAENLRRNGLDHTDVEPVPSTVDPAGPIDVALIKVARSNALLDEQLRRLRPLLTPRATVLGAGMVKHLSRSAVELFDQILGPSAASLARRKARVIRSELDPHRTVAATSFPMAVAVDDDLVLHNHANVFSRGRLDNGTRLLLDNLPALPDGASVVDLGCGNGALGAVLGRRRPDVTVRYVDVSYMAVASAELTHEANNAAASAVFDLADGLENVDAGSVDVIVNNPPFHEDQAIGDAVAWQMFSESREALRAGGELRVVGNRHLGYHIKLRRIFGNCETVASNPKFIVLSARR